MSHKMWQRRLGRFVMKNELATRSSPLPLTLLPHHPRTRLTEMCAYSGNESSQHTKFRVSATPTTTTTETVMSLIWFNKRNKVKTEREKPKRKTFYAQGEIEIGGHMSVHVNDTFENRTHNENNTVVKRRWEREWERKRRFSHCTV